MSVKKSLKRLQYKLFNNEANNISTMEKVKIIESARSYIKRLEAHIVKHVGELPDDIMKE